MEEKMVSIIVPVYNTSKYLTKCLDSLVRQTYQNLEIIIVNDGSTDSSLELCQQYADKDYRIKLYSKKNEGLQLARKSGLSKVSQNSQFIMFVDSDDFISLNAVEESLNHMDDDTDVVLFSFYQYSKLIKKVFEIEIESEITQKDFMSKYYKGFFGALAFPVQVWGKLYRKVLFDDIVFYSNFMGEDLCINLQVLPKARKMVALSKPLYYYRFGGGSSKFNTKFLEDYSIIKKVQNECAERYNVEEDCYRLINVETANVFYTYVKSYLYSLNDFSKIDYNFIDSSYKSYDYIKDAVEFLKEKDIDNVAKSENNRKHVTLLCEFDAERYANSVIEEIKKEKKSIKYRIKKIIKGII